MDLSVKQKCLKVSFMCRLYIPKLLLKSKKRVKISNSDVLCDLIGCPGPEVYLGSRYSSQARDSSSLPLPPGFSSGVKPPSTGGRDPSSLPVYYSGGAEGSSSGGGGGGGGGGIGKYSPTPPGGTTGLSLHLNPTTLAMLQQHNYIPFFRGTEVCFRPAETVDEILGSLLLLSPKSIEKEPQNNSYLTGVLQNRVVIV